MKYDCEVTNTKIDKIIQNMAFQKDDEIDLNCENDFNLSKIVNNLSPQEQIQILQLIVINEFNRYPTYDKFINIL